MQRDSTQGSKAVNVAEMKLARLVSSLASRVYLSLGHTWCTYKKQECAEKEEEENGSRKVRVVHDMLIYPRQRIEDSKSLHDGNVSHCLLRWSSVVAMQPTFILIWPKFTPSSSSNGGSPS